jgi:hypothetical protein
LPASAPPAPGHEAPSVSLELGDGWTLTVPDTEPAAIDPRRGWEQQGLETFAGTGTYRCRFDRPEGAPDGARWILTLPVVECAVRAELNGIALGARAWSPYRFEIDSGLLGSGDNELALHVANSAANRYYAGTRFAHGLQPSGLGAAPILEARG